MPLNYLYPAGRGLGRAFCGFCAGIVALAAFAGLPPHGVAIVCTINSLAEMDGRRVFGGFRFWFSSSVFCRKPDYLQRSNPVGICLVCGLSLFRFAIPRVRGRSIDVVAACLFICAGAALLSVRRSARFPPDCGFPWNSIVPGDPSAILRRSCCRSGLRSFLCPLLRMPNSAISAGCPSPIRSIRISVILL